MMKGWVHRQTGEVRAFCEGEELEGYGLDTHDLIDIPPELFDGDHEWDAVARAPKVSIGVVQDRLIARLKALRDQNEFDTVSTPQGVLQIDERSQGRMQRALELGRTYERLTGQTFATAWRMFDNSEVPVGVAHLEGWSLVIGAQVQHVFARYAELYAAIMAATSAEQLDAIDIEGGWDVGAA